MKNIKMIVTDLDGTFLKNDKSVSAYTLDTIAKLRKQGVLFVVATARPVRAVKDFLPQIKFDGGIFHNGAVVLHGDSKISGTGIENPHMVARKILEAKPDTCIAIESDDVLYANFDAGTIWEGIEYKKSDFFGELESGVADKIILKATTLEEMEEFKEYISENLYLQLSENTIAMIMNQKATKSNGIRLLAQKYKIDMEQIVAFGDDYNDMDMLAACGIGVAVSNALKEVKDVADTVCQSNEEDGVAKWLYERVLCD